MLDDGSIGGSEGWHAVVHSTGIWSRWSRWLSFVVAIAINVSPALAADVVDRSGVLLACEAKARKSLPDAPMPSLESTREQKAAQAFVDAMAEYEELKWSKMVACLPDEEVAALGTASGAINVAEGICGGRFSGMADRIAEAIVGAGRRLFRRHQQATYESNRDRKLPSLRTREPETIHFCQGIVDSYGPKGAVWPGLYLP